MKAFFLLPTPSITTFPWKSALKIFRDGILWLLEALSYWFPSYLTRPRKEARTSPFESWKMPPILLDLVFPSLYCLQTSRHLPWAFSIFPHSFPFFWSPPALGLFSIQMRDTNKLWYTFHPPISLDFTISKVSIAGESFLSKILLFHSSTVAGLAFHKDFPLPLNGILSYSTTWLLKW